MKSARHLQSRETHPPRTAAAITRLTWNDVISVSPVLLQTAENSKTTLLHALGGQASKTVALGLQGAEIVASKGRLVVEFSEAARGLKGVKLVTHLHGKKLPILMKNGRIVANARVVGGGAALLSAAAAAAAAIVVAAHLISGAENSKRLKEAQGKLDFLVVARKLDQCAKMEAVFRQAKELASMPDCPETRREIHRLGAILHELRASWRSEIKHRLEGMETKGSVGSRKWLPKPIRSLQESKERKQTEDEAGRTLAELRLINASLALHLVLSEAAGTEESFMSQSLPEEVEALRGISETIISLQIASRSKPKGSVVPLLLIEEAFEATISTFEPLIISKPNPRRLKKAA